MVTVSEAEALVLREVRDFGSEEVFFEQCLGRVLAKAITADRDLPPCNRVTMDGIAIRYQAFAGGVRSFTVEGTIAAGDAPKELASETGCVEIMTGGALPDNADTVVRYEDVMINDGVATITTEAIKQGQNIHRKGRDKQAGDEVVAVGQLVDATVVSMAASVGKAMLEVKRLPRVVVITTGDELADIREVVNPYQIRRSNNYTIKAVLQQFGITVAMRHLPDDLDTTRLELDDCLKNYDVVLMSGGVSMGKYDYVPRVLDELGVNRLFHKVQQRPGKPFWFGKSVSGGLVFAFPGNPVSTFLCLHRYFVPWLTHSMKWKTGVPNSYAVLSEDVEFAAPLQYFMQVAVSVNANGQLEAKPLQGNGSGDFANLLDTNAFMELPMEMSNFRKGEVYRIWPFKSIL